jgi:rare lipoprotein A
MVLFALNKKTLFVFVLVWFITAFEITPVKANNSKNSSQLPLTVAHHTPPKQPYCQTGQASWYGKRFHGKKTASGERFNMYAISAAHRTLPIPSYAKVTNLNNGKSIVVRINDRGPYRKKRILDLSYAAAKELDFTKKGHIKVFIEVL